MKLGQRIKKAIGLGSKVNSTFSSFIDWFSTPGKKSTQDYLNEYEGIVYACVSAISEEVANYTPKITKPMASGEMQELKNHAFLELLDNPNPGLSKYDLIEATQSYIELTGEAFWYFALGELTGKPKEIYPIRPDYMKVVVDKDTGEVTGYEVNRPDGQRIPLELNEVLHFKMFNPNNRYRGLGTLQAGSNYVDIEKYSTRFTKNFIYNNATPPGILTVGGDISKRAYNKFKSEWKAKVAGIDNAGKIAIIRGGDAEFTKVGVALSELDLETLSKLSEDKILRIFRVPRGILGFSDESGLGRASVETLEYIFIKRVVNPKMNRIDDTLQFALDRFYKADKLNVGHDNVVPADKRFELEERTAAVDMWLTRNEIRTEDGLPDVDGGDTLYQTLSQLPLDGATAMAEKKLKKKGQDGEVKKPVGIIKITKTVETTKGAKENFRLLLMATQQAYERQFKRQALNLIRAQEKRILGSLEPQKSYTKKTFDDILFELEAERQAFVAGLLPVLEELTEKAAKIAVEFAGAEAEVELTAAVRKSLADSIGRMATNYNQATLKKLTKTLSEGVLAGESVGKLAGRVSTVYKEAKGFRAERIARTETLKASNYAANLGYMQSGVVSGKQWYVNPGACEFCAAMNGKIVQLEQSFREMGEEVEGTNGGKYLLNYETVETPPLHPDCRCTIIPVRF